MRHTPKEKIFKMKSMNMKRMIIAALLTLPTAGCFLPTAFSQDIHFTQFYMSPLVQNPAFAGANYDMQAVLNYKDQWKSVVQNPYRTLDASYDMRFGKKEPKSGYWGAGIILYNDKAGDAMMGTFQVSAPVAYHVLLGEHSKLSAGVQPSFFQRSVNVSNLEWGNQYVAGSYSASNPTGEPLTGTSSFNFFDVSSGIMWTFDKGEMYISAHDHLKINLGFSVYHITQPKYTYYSSGNELLYRKYVVYANMNYGIKNTPLSFVPGMIFYRQGPAQEVLVGTSLRYLLKENSKYTSFVNGAAISLGAYFRTKDAIAATMLLELGNYSIGFSYDVNTSDLKGASNQKGGFEISLRFLNPNPFTGGGGNVSRIQ
jgi:type IX secretion system PorP/SprF family membrane protein